MTTQTNNIWNTLSEEQIERRAERIMDSLDRRYMQGLLDEQTYNNAVQGLHAWVQSALQKYARK